MIPKLHYISQGINAQEHLNNIQAACTSGVELVQLRLKQFDTKTVLETAKKAREITERFQTRLMINDFYKIAREVKADGVHLEQLNSCPKIVRKELASWQIIGGNASTIEECKKLIEKKVDYIELGPFRLNNLKNNSNNALGEKGFSTILSALKSNIPIIATGGITLNDILDVMITGVYGIAVSEEITRNFNSIPKFKEIISGEKVQEQTWKPNKIK
jgi:thiamine-phosphate pyrophosphorylase